MEKEKRYSFIQQYKDSNVKVTNGLKDICEGRLEEQTSIAEHAINYLFNLKDYTSSKYNSIRGKLLIDLEYSNEISEYVHELCANALTQIADEGRFDKAAYVIGGSAGEFASGVSDTDKRLVMHANINRFINELNMLSEIN